MMRKVKVKSPKKSSTLKRMNINLYGDNVTTPKLELPTAQFGKGILGRTAQPDPGSIRSTTKSSAIEEAKARQEAKDQGLGKTIGLGAAGFLTGALSSIPIIGGAFEGLNEKVQEKDKSGAAGIASGIGKAAIGTTSAVLSGGTMGVGEISEGVGDIMGGASEVSYNKGNDERSEKLGKAEQAFDTIAPVADMASGFAGGGAEGAAGMFEGPEGFKGGMKSLLGGMPTAKFGTKLPLEMELMPEGGKMVDGYLHEEGGVITKSKGKPVAEIEGGEVLTPDGIVYSDTTINPETGKPFSKDAKKIIKIKDDNTRRLAEEELYIKQEKAKEEMQGLENIEEDMKKYKKGGSLKAIPSDNKGLPQLPESIRNQMGYMKKGGGLWANIHAKRKRGEAPAKPGDPDYPDAKQWKRNTAMYGKKLNLPKMQNGDVIDPTIIPEGEVMYNLFGSQNMQMPTPSNKSVPLPDFKGMSSDEDIFSYGVKGEDPGTLGKEVITGEEDFTKSQIRDINKSTREGTRNNTTPGDKTQLAGNMIAPLANLAAMRSIRENVVDYGKDRSITTEQRVSTADVERAARQEGAATRAGLTGMGSDAMKSAIATGTTKAIQDAILQGERINKELAMRREQARTQRSQFNVKQEDLTKVGRQVRRDLATTTGLTAAEQTGKALVDLGLTKNQGLTNTAQLKVLQEAFPDFTITQDNMKSFIRDLSTGKEEKIYKYRT
jgi:hypothetical protein